MPIAAAPRVHCLASPSRIVRSATAAPGVAPGPTSGFPAPRAGVARKGFIVPQKWEALVTGRLHQVERPSGSRVPPAVGRAAVLGMAFLAVALVAALLAAPGNAQAPTGGPTYLSYKYVDSTAPACAPPPAAATPCPPGFVWELITGPDITANLNPDLPSLPVPIGFPFDYYGTTYTDVRIHENGYLGFDDLPGSNEASYRPKSIPNALDPNKYIAGLMTNLEGVGAAADGNPCGGIIQYETIGQSPDRQFVAEWLGVNLYAGGNVCGTTRVSFQVRLLETSNHILILLKDAAFVEPPAPNPPPPPPPAPPPPLPPPPPPPSVGVLVGIELDGGLGGGGHGLQYFFQDSGDPTPINLANVNGGGQGRAILYYRNLPPVAHDLGPYAINEDCSPLYSAHGCPLGSGQALTLAASDPDPGDSVAGYCLDAALPYGSLTPAVPVCPATVGVGNSFGTEYRPGASFCGTETFTYRAVDNYNGPNGPFLSEPATVTVDVACLADAPIATDDFYVLWENCSPEPAASCGTLFFQAGAGCLGVPEVRCNDDERDDREVPTPTPPHLSFEPVELVTGPSNGVLKRVDGSGTDPSVSLEGGFRYIPDDYFCGSDSFTYRLLDDDAPLGLPVPTYSNVATVTLSVTCQGAQPEIGFIASSTTAEVGQYVTFFDITQNANPNVQIVAWLWDFDEGHLPADSDRPFLKHAFSSPGVYNVCLTVTNNLGGQNKFCREITVTYSGAADGGGAGNLRANAGEDQDVPEGAEVTLRGGATGGTPTVWNWRQLGGGPRVTLSDPAQRDVTFTSPPLEGSASLRLTFELVAASATDVSLPDIVVVTVSTGNHRPVARTPEFIEVHEGDLVTLDGSASSDPDGDSITYAWSISPATPTAPKAAGTTTSKATFSVPEGAVGKQYIYTLEVSDGKAKDTNSIQVLVIPKVYVGPGFKWEVGANGNVTFTPLEPICGDDDAEPTASCASTFVWVFGDGTIPIGTAGPTTHRYAQGGVYTVQLTSRDELGVTRDYQNRIAVSTPAQAPVTLEPREDGAALGWILGGAGLLLAAGLVALVAALRRRRQDTPPQV